MSLTTVIFDMDGLLIDSEPLWYDAAKEVMLNLGVSLNEDAYATTIGLRTRECLHFWFNRYKIDHSLAAETEKNITRSVIAKVLEQGTLMPGVKSTLDFFGSKNFRIGLATSSPTALIEAVLQRTGLTGRFQAISSAEHLSHGKPHPQVYLDCAALLDSHPTNCVCFEDSFNGMIAAKAARMKCVVVPAPQAMEHKGWDAADAKIPSLTAFDEHVFSKLDR
jgi:mannitol-1-/sugar-/sorbitol-6-/2-deoxyglucose-6-phosphatase